MGVFIGLCIAAGLGVWAYSDAKNLERQGIQVGSFSAVGWGCLVALVAIVFGIMYLVQRPQAIATRALIPGYDPGRAWFRHAAATAAAATVTTPATRRDARGTPSWIGAGRC